MASSHTFGPAQLRDAFVQVNDRIADAAARRNRSREDVLMMAVTKYAGPDQIRQIVELGQADLGESRVQQLVQRAPQLTEFLSRKRTLGGASTRPETAAPEQVRWHMIGQLQRNKIKQCVPHVVLIHSVDNLRLAEELHTYGARIDATIDILVQVNASGESSKGGVAAPAVVHLLEQIDTMLHLRPRGLMTMAPYSEKPEDSRPTFARTADIFADCKAARVGGPDFRVLSMGMSNDFEVAIEEGANLVRLGRSLFGEHAPDGEAASEA